MKLTDAKQQFLEISHIDFAQIGREMWKIGQKFIYAPKCGFHCTDFHETYNQ
jgi:hypothetical protein